MGRTAVRPYGLEALVTDAFLPALRPDLFGQLAATDPYQGRARRLFERGQVVAVNGNQADVRVGYDARGAALELKQVPIESGYVPRVGDWVAMQYEAGHSSAPWITGPSMAADDSSDSAGIGVFPVRESEPDAPQQSAIYFDETRQTWRGWDGEAWVDFAAKLHNTLPDLQGGAAGEYYHLTAAQTASLVTLHPFTPGCVLFADASGHIATDAGFSYDAAADTASLGRLLLAAGSAAAPSLARIGFTDDGIYWSADGALGIALGGVPQFGFSGGAGVPSFALYTPLGGGDSYATYIAADGVNRRFLSFPGSNYVVLQSRGVDGIVQIRANTAVAGAAGEVTVATFEDDKVTFAVPVLLPNGSAAAPSLAASADPHTGFDFPTGDVIGSILGGTERTRWITTAYHPTTNEAIDLGLAGTRWGNVYCKEGVYGFVHTFIALVAPGGPATAGADKLGASLIAPYAGNIVFAQAYAQVAPGTQALIFDINLNGVSIWNATPANRVQIAAAANYGSQTVFDTTTCAKGDRFTFDIDQIGIGPAGSNVTVELTILKTGSVF